MHRRTWAETTDSAAANACHVFVEDKAGSTAAIRVRVHESVCIRLLAHSTWVGSGELAVRHEQRNDADGGSTGHDENDAGQGKPPCLGRGTALPHRAGAQAPPGELLEPGFSLAFGDCKAPPRDRGTPPA